MIKKYFLKINFKIFKNIFFFTSIFYFTYYLIFNKEKIYYQIQGEIHYSFILLSFLFCTLSIYFNGLAWKNIIIWFGQSLKENNLVYFYILTNSLKYVPGGVWHFFERFTFLKKRVNENLAFCINLIEPYFMLCASLVLTSLGVVYNPLLLLLLLPSIFLHRNLIYIMIIKLQSFKDKSIKIFKKNYTKNQLYQQVKIKSAFPFQILSIEMLFIFFKFFGFMFCFYIFNDLSNIDYLFIFTIFCLSWSIGLIIPAAPGGIGVFEGCFLFLIGDDYTRSSLIMTLIIFRLISSSADLLLSAPLFIKKVLKKN